MDTLSAYKKIKLFLLLLINMKNNIQNYEKKELLYEQKFIKIMEEYIPWYTFSLTLKNWELITGNISNKQLNAISAYFSETEEIDIKDSSQNIYILTDKVIEYLIDNIEGKNNFSVNDVLYSKINISNKMNTNKAKYINSISQTLQEQEIIDTHEKTYYTEQNRYSKAKSQIDLCSINSSITLYTKDWGWKLVINKIWLKPWTFQLVQEFLWLENYSRIEIDKALLWLLIKYNFINNADKKHIDLNNFHQWFIRL